MGNSGRVAAVWTGKSAVYIRDWRRIIKKSRIRETLNVSMDGDKSNNTIFFFFVEML